MQIKHERRTGRDRRQYDRELPFWMDQELTTDRRSQTNNDNEDATASLESGRSENCESTFVRTPATNWVGND